MQKFIIYGAGSLGKELYFFRGLHTAGADVVFIDDAATPNQVAYTRSVVKGFAFRPTADTTIYVAIADPTARSEVSAAIKSFGLRIADYRHPTSTTIYPLKGYDGKVLMPYALLSCGCDVGPGLLLNVYASVGHDCKIGDYCTLGPYAGLAGNVTLGDRVFVGMGAKVLPGITIGDDAYIGAGSVVLRDVPAGARVFGNPAKTTGIAK